MVAFTDPTATEDDDNADEDEDKYVDEVDMPGTKVYIIINSTSLFTTVVLQFTYKFIVY